MGRTLWSLVCLLAAIPAFAGDGGIANPIALNDAGCLVWDPQQAQDDAIQLPDGGLIAPGGACITLHQFTQDGFRKDPPKSWTPNIPLAPDAGTVTINTWDPNFTPTIPVPPAVLTPFSGTCADQVGWSFETGFQGWSPSGLFVAGRTGRVYGNNVHIDRMMPPGYTSGAIATDVGGDYWQFSRDVNPDGAWWIGTGDVRPKHEQLPGQRLAESATGTLVSPQFMIDAHYIDFWIGGAADQSQRVELEVMPQAGATQAQLIALFDGIGVSEFPDHYTAQSKIDGPWVIVRASSPQVENDYMRRRVAWDVRNFAGMIGRIRIVDDTRTGGSPAGPPPMAHVNVDLVRCTNGVQADTTWNTRSLGGLNVTALVGQAVKPPPLWGTTDAHTHALANLAFGGHLIWGDPADSLSAVYNCDSSLPAIVDNFGNTVRPAISNPSLQTDCYVDFGIVLMMSAAATADCIAISGPIAAIPFVGPALAATEVATCTAAVVVATGALLSSPVMTNWTRHGATMPTSGGLKLGDFLESFEKALTGDPKGTFQAGVIDSLDWSTADGKHTPNGLGRLHQQYQSDMIKRAWTGGLRLIVVDTINGRAIQALLDAKTDYSDWQAVIDMVTGLKRLTSCGGAGAQFPIGPLCNIAQIVTDPVTARRVIAAGKLAIVMGTEVDELGKDRPATILSQFGHVPPDSPELQVQDLFGLGIRKITAIHGSDNPLGGSGLFHDIYLGSTEFHNSTLGDDGAMQGTWQSWKPGTEFALPASFVDPIAGLVLGTYEVGKFMDSSLTNHGFFQVNPSPTFPVDAIGGYDQITFRFGFDSAGRPLTRFKGGFVNGNVTVSTPNQWTSVVSFGEDEDEGNLFPDFPAGVKNFQYTKPLEQLNTINNLDWILGSAPGGAGSSSSCALGDAHIPIEIQKNQLDDIAKDYDKAPVGHRNLTGLTTKGQAFVHAMMVEGITFDLDHFSQAARLQAFQAAADFATEVGAVGTPAAPADYAVFGVHSSIRELERSGPVPLELADDKGFASETDRTMAEYKFAQARGGVFSPAANITVVAKTLVTDVNNNCDYSSKSWSLKYLNMITLMKGRGLTPSTDMNGLTTPMAPRFGVQACHVSTHTPDDLSLDPFLVDNFPADWVGATTRNKCWNDSKGSWDPACPSMHEIQAQHGEGNAVEYADYPAGTVIDSTHTRILARSKAQHRDDNNFRPTVDEFVMIGSSHQMAKMVRFKNPGDTSPTNTGWDFNLDGLKHIGLYPDFFQDVRNDGATWEQLVPAFDAAEDYVAMWERNCRLANKFRTQHGVPTIACPL